MTGSAGAAALAFPAFPAFPAAAWLGVALCAAAWRMAACWVATWRLGVVAGDVAGPGDDGRGTEGSLVRTVVAGRAAAGDEAGRLARVKPRAVAVAAITAVSGRATLREGCLLGCLLLCCLPGGRGRPCLAFWGCSLAGPSKVALAGRQVRSRTVSVGESPPACPGRPGVPVRWASRSAAAGRSRGSLAS